jgi:hypothetical protein
VVSDPICPTPGVGQGHAGRAEFTSYGPSYPKRSQSPRAVALFLILEGGHEAPQPQCRQEPFNSVATYRVLDSVSIVLKRYRRIATPYGQLAATYLAMVTIALILE